MASAYPVGIDLGTTNSVVSVFRRGQVETLTIDGKRTTPSVVSFDGDEILVGDQAKQRLEIFPETTIGSVKRFMGDRSQFWEINGAKYSPVDISALILKKLVRGASEALASQVTEAVVTVPAYFTEDQKEDTKKAALQAGLTKVSLMTEPTAAAVSYGYHQQKDQLLLVYDLGGGTFDVSLLKVQESEFTELATAGDSLLGGDDFDQALANRLLESFARQSGKDLAAASDHSARIARQRLREQAEKAKIRLATMLETEITFPDLMGMPFAEKITRDEFVALIRPFLDKTVQEMEKALKDAGLSADDVDKVVLVGGSTMIPAVKDLLTERIKEPYRADNVAEVVSQGAAIWAYEKDLPDRKTILHSVTAHSLGIKMVKEDLVTEYFQPIIPRQTQYPCTRGQTGFSVSPNQTHILMEVYRGEDTDCKRNYHKGELKLPIVKQWDSVPAVALFHLDENGTINFMAVQMLLSQAAKDAIKQKHGWMESRAKMKEAEKTIRDYFDKQVKAGGQIEDEETLKTLQSFIDQGLVDKVQVEIKVPEVKAAKE